MQEIAEISVTFDRKEDADSAARHLVAKRLAACVHVGAPLDSVYWWDGAVQSDTEIPLTAKTSVALVEQVVATLTDIHPYDLPAIVIHRCEAPEATAAWIAAETEDPSDKDNEEA